MPTKSAEGVPPDNTPLPPLIEDLLNPSITTAELCQLHDLTLDQLDDLLASPRFERARDRFHRVNANRRTLAEDEANTLAITRLTDLLRDRPETPAHAETQRKAATTLHRNPPASDNTPPTNPKAPQPVPDGCCTMNSTPTEGVPQMNTKAAASIFTLAIGSGIFAAAYYINTPQPATTAPTGTLPTQQPKASGMDLFSTPATPGPASVFFQSVDGQPMPARAQREVQGWMDMMAGLVERMNEFDANGDGMLDDLEKVAMGYRLRKEFIAKYDLDGDGDMSRDEWKALQQSMFEQTPQGQALMQQFDLDGDGVLSEDEQAALDAHLAQQEQQRQAEERARMDTDGDGNVSNDERRDARRQEREFWQSQMRTAESSFDRDGDGELNIEESRDAWEAWVEYQTIDAFISDYDTDGDRSMGPADYDAFLSDYERRHPNADVNNDGEIDVQDINAFRDLVLRSRSV